MREFLTDLLDVLAVLLIAAGLAALAYRWVGWACLAVAGVVVLVGSLLADWLDRPKPPVAEESGL